MEFTVSDWVGSIGVTILLAAFLLNLLNKISKDGLPYILMNIAGAGLACAASWMIHYIPFVVLEGCWVLVSGIALVNYFREN
jgi:hypothetical protein